ncbi:Uncharacterised protein [Mycobacterium tuberculosis]|nr:Uncharacterised protein [Mycobacterium tuberculosis]
MFGKPARSFIWMAPVILPSASVARFVTLLYSFSSVWPRACCAICCMAALTAVDP